MLIHLEVKETARVQDEVELNDLEEYPKVNPDACDEDVPTESSKPDLETTPSSSTKSLQELSNLIKSSFAGFKVQPGQSESEPQLPRTGNAAFAQVIQEWCDDMSVVEEKTLKVVEGKFDYQRSLEEKGLEMGFKKVIGNYDTFLQLLPCKFNCKF